MSKKLEIQPRLLELACQNLTPLHYPATQLFYLPLYGLSLITS